MIRRLSFASALVYASRGESAVALKSQKLRDRIKRTDPQLIRDIAAHVLELSRAGVFPGFFDPTVTLVPVPGHAPLAPGAVSTSFRIADALQAVGLAGSVSSCLERAQPVTKSAFAPAEQRPKARDHFDSLRVHAGATAAPRMILVDDFVTRGATMIGAASRLFEQFPTLDLKAFALVRSITSGDIDAIRQPCIGTLELRQNGESFRNP